MAIGNGNIPLRIGNLIDTVVYGGPYRDFGSWEHIPGMFGVKMAVEIEAPCHVDVPTRDYDVPKVSDLQAGITRALMAMINEQPVYVGCWGGIGRTGLFLAALAKVQIEYRKSQHRVGGGEDPIWYVREHFLGHALETQEQMDYIADLDVSMIVTWLKVTQAAMGLNGFTPARESIEPEGPVRRVVEPDWIPDADKIDNPAFDTYKSSWKDVRGGDEVQYADTDSAEEGTEENAQWLQAESLQSQIDELTNEQERLWNAVDDGRKSRGQIAAALHKLATIMRKMSLTKPSLHERLLFLKK